ncbi:type II toxin-antitoxin system RelE/ParE family toxin [Chelatococcus sambhunathii]|uniref:Type II toxin-antitoxin system RelE/ParE family toxin n=1 Tax=Chelatococcus sambhunathii TaxID=363953 RepID=A0ABU1DE17_9HYPH|nr:type II toxin-antitoxin system RelE/ParE family toxin [Chelatococcus sambhunathii]MDR4306339.1 type II toxin-antitoxin system RelE/ParE family toxin [Chelatococcus sambhunathii]
MRIVVSRAAGADVRRIADFLQTADQALALRAVALVRAAVIGLRELSERGVVINRNGDRRLAVPFGRAAYLLDYRVDRARGTVTILRVRHSREAR